MLGDGILEKRLEVLSFDTSASFRGWSDAHDLTKDEGKETFLA